MPEVELKPEIIPSPANWSMADEWEEVEDQDVEEEEEEDWEEEEHITIRSRVNITTRPKSLRCGKYSNHLLNDTELTRCKIARRRAARTALGAGRKQKKATAETKAAAHGEKTKIMNNMTRDTTDKVDTVRTEHNVTALGADEGKKRTSRHVTVPETDDQVRTERSIDLLCCIPSSYM